MWRNWNSCALLVVMLSGPATMKNRLLGPQRKLNLSVTTYDPAIPLSHLYSKELRTGPKPDICILMFIAILFTITKRWKQPKCTLTDEWTNKTLYIQTMKYYSTLKRLTCTTSGINLEDMIPSERSQPLKDKYCVVPLT